MGGRDNSHLLQFSQTSGGDSRKYSPNRDIAYVFPQLCKSAISALDSPELWKGGIKKYLESTGTTVEDVAAASRAFAQGIVLFTKYGLSSPGEALGQAGFFDTPEPAQDVIAMRLGHVFTGAFFTAIRDVTPMGGQPPAYRDIESLVHTAEMFARELEKRQ